MNTEAYLSLITSQHRQQPKFMESVRISIDPLIDCLSCLDSLIGKFDLATASGDQLQIIADWIGAPNSIPNSIPKLFFGFQGQPASLPFGETYDFSVGGYWRESGVSGNSAMAMSIELFRRVIRAKILLNNSDCSPDSAQEIISIVLDKKFKFTDNLNMTVTFEFLEDYEVFERELVRLMFPLPSGTRLVFYGEEDD